MSIPEPAGLLFASMFAGWNRLEARSRKDDFAQALSAKTADPLWMLARQWQFLELKGEDAATPIGAKLAYETAAPDQVQLGRQAFEQLNGVPLEVLVERETVDWDWRLRVRAGQHYERMARLRDPANADALISQARSTYALTRPTGTDWLRLDLATRRFVAFVENRAIDGKRLYDDVTGNSFTSTISGDWKAWFDHLYSQPTAAPGAWQPTRLDYEFRLRQGTPMPSGSLHAPSYRNGSVDWDTFVLDQAPATTFNATTSLPLTPVHARFAGQPMRRWWEFEDSAVDFGALDIAKTDLAKLVLVEFALVAGDDWFVIPLEADPNTLVRATGLEVQDCFGLRFTIHPARHLSSNPLEVWEMFALAPELRAGQSGDFLYVPPSAGVREESPILEEVRLARDEGANLVFGIEHTVPNSLGEPVAGLAQHLEFLRRRPAITASAASGDGESPNVTVEGAELEPPAKLQYVLATTVPANWIPYLATDEQNVVQGLPQRSVKLHRGAMVSTEVEGGLGAIAPHSRLLNGVEWIHEEAVGREGVRVELRRQRMRSAKGETFVWLGRKVGMGKGQARSGLRFDSVGDLGMTGSGS